MTQQRFRSFAGSLPDRSKGWTGERVRLEQIGEVPPCGAATQLTVYRIIQEALTNFLKHAGPTATALVRLQSTSERITVEVTDNGLGAASQADGLGHGLKGMHERVTAMGGVVESGPLPDGGFRVTAMMPVTPTGGHRRRQPKPEGESRDQRLPG